jgi:hypothetical protein
MVKTQSAILSNPITKVTFWERPTMTFRTGAKDNLLRLISAPVHSRTSEGGADSFYKPERQMFGLKPFAEQILWRNTHRGGRISGNTQAATWTNQSVAACFYLSSIRLSMEPEIARSEFSANVVPHLL